MKNKNQLSTSFISRYRRSFLTFIIASTAGTAAAQADSPTDNFLTPNTSLLKTSNWSTGNVPAAGVTGIISEGAAANPLGWNNNTNVGGTVGNLDFVSGSTNLVVGDYTTKTANTAEPITLAGSTLNSQPNTVIANSSGNTILFENDVAPSGDDLTESGLTTYTLGNTSNVIQATSNSNIIIDNVVTGTNAGLTFLGSGSPSKAGATLEFGAGSANDVTGGVAANAPTPANGGSFSGSATVQTNDKNSFTGGLSIGDVGGVSNAGVVKFDGGNALPTTGAVTVNTNSQLVLNGGATYGGATQTVNLNGSGTGGTTNGALATGSSDTSTLQTTVNLASNSTVSVNGTSTLTVSGQVTGGGTLQSAGTGTLKLTGSNNNSGGTQVTGGNLVSGNANSLGSGGVTVAGGNLSSSIAATTNIGGALALNTGSIALTASATPTLTLALNKNYTMSGGSLSLTYASGNLGAIASLGGTSLFSITGGTLNLNNSLTTLAYSQSYDILNGFTSGSVSNLSITNYDTSDYTANLSTSGVLSFVAVPEPKAYAFMLGGLIALIAIHRLRHRNRGDQI